MDKKVHLTTHTTRIESDATISCRTIWTSYEFCFWHNNHDIWIFSAKTRCYIIANSEWKFLMFSLSRISQNLLPIKPGYEIGQIIPELWSRDNYSYLRYYCLVLLIINGLLLLRQQSNQPLQLYALQFLTKHSIRLDKIIKCIKYVYKKSIIEFFPPMLT